VKIKFFCPLWGSENIPFKRFLRQVKDAGYDGVEMGFPLEYKVRRELVDALNEFDLEIIGQHWQTVDTDLPTHRHNFERHLLNLAEINPLFICSQTGKDYFSRNQNQQLIDLASEIMSKTGTKVIHETHRGKFSFASHVMASYLKDNPLMRICLDISHWCCVASSYLEDQQDAVALALKHTDHIHARVGYTQGPQIMDPRTEESNEALQIHLRWWAEIIDKRKKDGFENFTITPEFGAPPYQQLLPYTRLPIYSQWDINVFMMNLLKKRFE